MNGTHKQIFIVITQTGTMLSRILKRITGAEYNHASLSLSQDLTRMYSFGRRHPYNPFWGGFVIESPHAGTFRRFSDTTAIILAVEITEERYAALEATLEAMWARREQFSYNFGRPAPGVFPHPLEALEPLLLLGICGGYAAARGGARRG